MKNNVRATSRDVAPMSFWSLSTWYCWLGIFNNGISLKLGSVIDIYLSHKSIQILYLLHHCYVFYRADGCKYRPVSKIWDEHHGKTIFSWKLFLDISTSQHKSLNFIAYPNPTQAKIFHWEGVFYLKKGWGPEFKLLQSTFRLLSVQAKGAAEEFGLELRKEGGKKGVVSK